MEKNVYLIARSFAGYRIVTQGALFALVEISTGNSVRVERTRSALVEYADRMDLRIAQAVFEVDEEKLIGAWTLDD